MIKATIYVLNVGFKNVKGIQMKLAYIYSNFGYEKGNN